MAHWHTCLKDLSLNWGPNAVKTNYFAVCANDKKCLRNLRKGQLKSAQLRCTASTHDSQLTQDFVWRVVVISTYAGHPSPQTLPIRKSGLMLLGVTHEFSSRQEKRWRCHWKPVYYLITGSVICTPLHLPGGPDLKLGVSSLHSGQTTGNIWAPKYYIFPMNDLPHRPP